MLKITLPNNTVLEGSCEGDFLQALGPQGWQAIRDQVRAAAQQPAQPQVNGTNAAQPPADTNANQAVAQAMREVLPAVVDAIREGSRGEEREGQRGDQGGAIYERSADGRYVPVPRERSPLRALSKPGRISRSVPERLRAGTSYLAVAGFEEHEASAVTLTEALRHEDVASSSSPWVAAGVATIAGSLLGAWLSSE